MTSDFVRQEADRIAHGQHSDPFRFLGIHHQPGAACIAVRAFLPEAEAAWVVDAESGGATEMQRRHPAGVWEAEFPPDRGQFPYRLRIARGGETSEQEDPYRFGSLLGELDLYLFGEGRHLEAYRMLGAHPTVVDGVAGTRFAVWAPAARRVSVVGPWNAWDGRCAPMRVHPGVGVWELFLPGVDEGTVYKYEILPQNGPPFLKSDPFAFRTELRPATAAVVHRIGEYAWGDGDWLDHRRAVSNAPRAMSVYEVHLGSWRRIPEEGDRPLTYRELAHQLGDYVAEMGFTHVELLPVAEHPYDPSWGYQVTGYYAPTSRFGSPEDFKYLVDHLHQRGIGVIVDWVPAHFPKDAPALRRFDGTALYEHEDPRQGEHPDWGTMVFNFGRNEVRNFLIANALFWLEEYHIDGLRVDAVASMLYLDYSREAGAWVPNRYGGRENLEAIEFLQQLNTLVRERWPGALMIAEESTAWPGVTQPAHLGGLGFDFKWNMGWMNDFLRFIEQDPIHRRYHSGLLTFSLMYAFSENFVLPLSHDEVVHGKGALAGKMPGDDWQKLANLRLALGFMWGHPGKKLLFMGGELGQWREWSESRSLDWHLLDFAPHAGVQRWVRDLNLVYRAEPALWTQDTHHSGFEWIDFHDVENSVVSFVRRGTDPADELVFVCNFTPVPRHEYRIGVPGHGGYRTMLNSDAPWYGGSGLGNREPIESEPVQQHGRANSIRLNLPPLGVLVLKRA